MLVADKIHPVNHFRFCPRCGNPAIFDDKRFSLSCPSCGFVFFMNSSAAVGGVIFNEKGELLLSKRGIEPHYGMLDLPGGFIDPGESAEEAIIREVKEELNLAVEKVVFLKTYPNRYFFSGTVVFTLDLFFECFVPDFSTIKWMDDVMGFEFLHPSQVDYNKIAFESVKKLLKQVLHEQGY